MITCRIFDDIYGEKVYSELKNLLPQLTFPIKTNIDNPIPYLSNIKDGDIIILDNFFFRDGKEQPLGDDFLWQYLKLGLKCKIICVSNYGEKNINRFSQWYKTYIKGDIIGFIPSKDGKEISELISDIIAIDETKILVKFK